MHLLLYDGDCGMCSRVVRAVLALDRKGAFAFASLQSPFAARQLTRFGIEAGRMDTMVVIRHFREPDANALLKSAAALFVLSTFGWPWRAAAAVLNLLPRSLADRGYDFVARHRRRIPSADTCARLSPEQRRRFLDLPGDV
jgi:predicted DCC family thiol-disulfide oxidoreductase YuxK